VNSFERARLYTLRENPAFCKGTASQLAKKRAVLKGHGFSRAVTAAK
jgi:hypothetical protein